MKAGRTMLLVLLATIACAATLLLAPAGLVWLRVLAAIPFLFLLPGMALLLFVDPDVRLGTFEWFTLAVSASIASLVLVGVGLGATGSLTAARLVAAVSALTLLCIGLAWPHHSQLAPSGAAPGRRSPLRRGVLGATGLLAAAALVLALSTPHPQTTQSAQIVELWGLPDAARGELRIGAQNVDATSDRFLLTISQGGSLISQQSVDIPAGHAREYLVKRSALLTATSPVEAVLTDARGSLPPRSISVWVTR